MKIKKISVQINGSKITLTPNPPIEVPDEAGMFNIVDKHAQAIFEEIRQKEVKK